MKKKVFHIDIPTPCHEDWQNMTPTEKGAFCASCQKEVIDFTQKTPAEIAQYFASKKSNNCGRFYSSQLEENYTYYEPQKTNNLKYAAGLALGLLVTENNFAKENNKSKTEITEQRNDSTGFKIQYNNLIPDSLIIRGTIVDDSTNEALIGVNVTEENTTNGTVTDIDGAFELKVSKITAKIIASYIGYNNETISINQNNRQNIKIRMNSDIPWMGEIVVTTRIKRSDDIYTNPPYPYIHRKNKRKTK